jgi:hypothetical protein
LASAVLFFLCAAIRPAAGQTKDCPSPGPRLSTGPLTVEWSEEDRPRKLEVRADGAVVDRGKQVARVAGACIVGADDRWLLRVDRGGVVDARGALPRTTFKRRARVETTDGESVAIGEVLVGDGENGIAVARDGGVWSVPPTGAAVSLPAQVTGLSRKKRRTALLLLLLGPRLDGGAGSK